MVKSKAPNSSAKKRRNASITPAKKACIGCNKRPKSAERTYYKAKKLSKIVVPPPCNCHHEHNVAYSIDRQRIPSQHTGLDDSPISSRLNKSVTFNNQVRVREYESLQNQKRLQEEEERKRSVSPLRGGSAYEPISPSRVIIQHPYVPAEQRSPLRAKYTPQASFPSHYGHQAYMSPIQNRHSPSRSPIRDSISSPLKALEQSTSQRSLHYNYTPDRRLNFSYTRPEVSQGE
jgi:hypothetical protein